MRPAVNSIWYVQPEFLVPATFDWSKSKIKPSFENSEAFLKFSTITSKIDFDFMGGYTWDDNPAMHVQRHFAIDTTMMPPKPYLSSLTITPEHHRLYIAGGSFSTEIKGFIFRGEGAYYTGKYFQTEDLNAQDALVQKDYLNYVAGLDFSIGKVKLSGQFIQKAIMDYKDNELLETPMFKGQYNNMATFLARYSCLNETLTLEYFMYYDFNYDDALIRPRILYDYSDSINLQFGVNIFTGSEGLFGQYDKNDMVYAKVYYNF
jgi:hypothetical protein